MWNDPAALILRMLDAIEHRRLDELPGIYHRDVSFRWQPGLPYSGHFTGAGIATMSERFAATWMPLQPDAETRRLDPRVVATDADGTVIVEYCWRGVDADGLRFETDTLAHYVVCDGRLLSARMFYDDLVGLIAFLDGAKRAAQRRVTTEVA